MTGKGEILADEVAVLAVRFTLNEGYVRADDHDKLQAVIPLPIKGALTTDDPEALARLALDPREYDLVLDATRRLRFVFDPEMDGSITAVGPIYELVAADRKQE